jgi:hypothetical protein
MISGIDGISIVSPYIVNNLVEPSIANVFHAEMDILTFILSLDNLTFLAL